MQHYSSPDENLVMSLELNCSASLHIHTRTHAKYTIDILKYNNKHQVTSKSLEAYKL